MKYLIINADDFGYSQIFNAKILELLKRRLLKSTSVMITRVNEDQAYQVEELVELNKYEHVSVGLHLEFSDYDFAEEIARQFERFVVVFGFEPSHIDLHKPAHWADAVPIVKTFCQEKEIPGRNEAEILNGTKMSISEIRVAMKNLKDEETGQIFFHPGTYDPESGSSLNKEREEDVQKIEELNLFLVENSVKSVSYLNLSKQQKYEG